ncbi:MAG: MBL fold metallo-hydrolase, partial [Bacteroidaceae bacterium]|nr:MBL fold metallo-hydrolase [Bacteroidaceae bacterium]
MEIKAIRMFDGGFMHQSFAFGGEEGKDMFDEQINYRSSLQNFLIDTGKEVILVDTGFKTGYAAPARKAGAPLCMGDKVADYMDAFAALGYKPEQVTKILITHKHNDHSDCIGQFPNAKVYIAPEDADALKLEGGNIIRAQYGQPFHNFPNAMQV